MEKSSSSSSSSSSVEVDESLYSRQLYVFGHEAQRKLGSASVLLVGLDGLGVEAAKNIILSGVKSISLHDNSLAAFEDLSSNFYLSEEDVGVPRHISSTKKLSELNPYVAVTSVSGELTTEIISRHSVVVLVNQSWETQAQIAEYCHLKGIAVLVGEARGVFGSVFVDLGREPVTVSDATGEEGVVCVIASITNTNTNNAANSDANSANSNSSSSSSSTQSLIVSVVEENRHGLETGETVLLTGITGMVQLNDTKHKVKVIDSHTFSIDVESNVVLDKYITGGYVTPVKMPIELTFKSLTETILDPGMINCDISKMDMAPVLHLAFRTLHKYKELNSGLLPEPGNQSHAQNFYNLSVTLNESLTSSQSAKVDEKDLTSERAVKLIKQFSLTCRGLISPVCALLGGILAQETLKAASGKFTPLNQWFNFNGSDVLPEEFLSVSEVSPQKCRYDGQIAVFGKTIQEKLLETNAFLVGAGAIGCEMLKNWAMMGISCKVASETDKSKSKKGQIFVTDMDQIERSNLSRQFLFRNSDIGQLKSTTAVRAAKEMNKNFTATAYDSKLGVETENLFGDDFFDSLDIVCAALDNVEARLYLDQRCLLYHKPMFEGGTLGAKGHTQVVIPGQTEHYGASRDPPEKSIPLCTLKSFPNRIEHTLQWAREYFEEIFKQTPDYVNRYIIDRAEFENYLNSQSNSKIDILQRVKTSLILEKPNDFRDCLSWARIQFEDLFKNKILQLLYSLPIDKIGADGNLFWSGAKKPPSPIAFDIRESAHFAFIISLAQMRANVYGLSFGENEMSENYVREVLNNVSLPVFRPTDVKISLTEEEAKEEKNNAKSSSSNDSYVDVDTLCKNLLSELPPVSSLKASNFKMNPVDFDKDVNAHMEVVCALSNARAANYAIPSADLHSSRRIAGRIIPAIASSTALVAGLQCLEILKFVQNKPIDKFTNTFSNLALPLFTSAEPDPPKSHKTKLLVNGKSSEFVWNQWSRVDIADRPELTLGDLIEYCDSQFGAELAMLSAGVCILFSAFGNQKKNKERKGMRLRDIYETVTKKEIPPSQKYLIFELILNDLETGDEIEMPYLRLKLRD